MTKSADGKRQYLVSVDAARLPQMFTDVLVIGGGVAGMRAALEASEKCEVLLVTKEKLLESNTYYAQGGIAAVLRDEDSFESHSRDTLDAGCGLADQRVVRHVITRGPNRIRELLGWGARFDMDADQLSFTREGGHSVARIVHAMGDSTGREVAECLAYRVTQKPNIRVMESTFVIDLLTRDGEVRGAMVQIAGRGRQIIWAKATVLATGGLGQLYRETTNPPIATGDGFALALRAGAVLADMEFVQFHPTTLYIAGASRSLISEAVRGEGARLVDKNGEPFMSQYHPRAELAPRDVVSRAIVEEMERTGATNVFLDLSPIPTDRIEQRFPYIAEICREFDIDIRGDLVPVRPSAHYMIGGVRVNMGSATSLARLFACGEVACTGLHGANRLGSNSLLEGLVYGQLAGANAAKTAHEIRAGAMAVRLRQDVPDSTKTMLDIVDVRNSLRAVMWRNVGIRRNSERLAETLEIIDFWSKYVMDKEFDNTDGWVLQNMLQLGRLTTLAAERRTETRGVHYRSDFPKTDDRQWKRHVRVQWTGNRLRVTKTPVKRQGGES